MKRIALCFGITTTLVASCSTQENDFQTPLQDDVLFYATFEQPVEEETRVYANDNFLLRWTAHDQVSIFNKNTYNQQYVFTGETGDNAGEFRKVNPDEFITGNAISNVISVYPYQASTKISESEDITVNLPAEQNYAENTFGLGTNTMVSVSSDNFLHYKTVGGYLVFKLYGEGVSVSSITLKGNNGEKLAGKATLTIPLDGVPTIEIIDNAKTEITLTCPKPVALGATAEESTTFWFVVPPIKFSEGFTITVNESTGGIFIKSTTKSVIIERNNLSKMAPMKVEVDIPHSVSIPEAIDLGLPSGLKWASFNLGASAPEEYGDYYAWGETEPKNDYSWATYKWCMGSEKTMIKYCSSYEFGYNGFTDDKTVLDLEDDAAHVILGGTWRIPTYEEWIELMKYLNEYCAWTWTTLNGVNGELVTAINGNSIFLPAAGNRHDTSLYNVGSVGRYWSSSGKGMHVALCIEFFSFTRFGIDDYRYEGLPIRPVSE